MMKSFLEYVAEDIIRRFSNEGNEGIDLTDVAIVFPNKRASLFLNQYLYKAAGNKPVWCPRYITISELFRSQSDLTTVDPIQAVCILYDVYKGIMEKDNPNYERESLDRFWSWGQMMLADFDDLDKNMGHADLIFNNVRDLEALKGAPEEYLTPEQIETLKSFFNLVSDNEGSVLKQNFEKLWNNLGNIYHGLNDELTSRGLAYEGSLYREVAERADSLKWPYKKYLFVGFNMAQASEQKLFMSMKKQDLALFYWDYDVYYEDKEAGHFIRKELLLKFPNELEDNEIFCNFNRKDNETGNIVKKDVTYLSASTENIQARYISDWLTEEGKNRLAKGQRTAIVLSDESLLKNVIHNLPKETSGRANITVGFPLSQSPVTSLVKNYLLLHRGEFDLRNVSNILRHPYADFLSKNSAELLEYLHTNKIFFPKMEDLCGRDEILDAVFNPYKDAEKPSNEALMSALLKILQVIGRECEARRLANLAEEDKDTGSNEATYEEQFMQESIFRMHNVINRIHDLISEGLDVDITTLSRIIDQIIQTTTMPFHGEPAVNLQIMGVLETRNLDFDHILLLSCNEGNLPKEVSSSSLIPYIVRQAHGLTTVNHKVAIYAYYFYRLLQRCDDISIAYNSSTEDGHTGQMSRFMLQLMVENENMNLTLKNLIAKQAPELAHSHTIEKDEAIMEVLDKVFSLSPSIINKYLRCPLQFYYDKLAGLRESDEEDFIDNRMFGTIFHAAAENMYDDIKRDGGEITKESIEHLLSKKGEPAVYRYVDEAFKDEFFNGRDPHYDGLQTINREVIKRFIINLLKEDKELAPFRIVGLEQDAYEKISFKKNDGTVKTLQIGGSIDRLDCITIKEGDTEKQVLRVVDYKTGRTEPKERDSIEELFMPKYVDEHATYLLQVMLYSSIVRHLKEDRMAYVHGDKKKIDALNTKNLAVRPALLYIQKPQSVKDPVIKIGKKDNATSVDDVLTYETEFRSCLNKLLAEIFDPEVPFTPTDNKKRCENCSYRNLCKR